MANPTQSVDRDTIERLAEKVTALVTLLERTRRELSETTADNGRLTKEVAALQDRLAAAQRDGAEVQTLVAERDQVRARVAEMLEQLEALDL